MGQLNWLEMNLLCTYQPACAIAMKLPILWVSGVVEALRILGIPGCSKFAEHLLSFTYIPKAWPASHSKTFTVWSSLVPRPVQKRAWYLLFACALNFPTFREFRIIPCYLCVLWCQVRVFCHIFNHTPPTMAICVQGLDFEVLYAFLRLRGRARLCLTIHSNIPMSQH